MLECVLVVGLGSIGRRHARLVRTLAPAAKIVALRHRKSEDSAPDPDVDASVTSLDEALRFRPQAAVIASPATHHLAVALPLARAGVHLLIEKPIAGQSVGVSDLIEACRAAGTTLMVGYNLRFLRSLQRFQELLGAGHVGRILSVRAETGQYLPSWRPSADYRRTVSAQAALGGGVLLELSHEIDYLRALLGDVAWVSAVTRKQSALEIDVEDTAHIVLGFVARRGEVPVIASLDIDFVRHDSTRTCTVIGDEGSLRWNALTGTVEFFARGGVGWNPLDVIAEPKDSSYLAEWRHFLTCINDGVKPLVTGDDGLAVLEIVEAARESSARGAVVHLRPVA